MADEASIYPQALDRFEEVSDADTPENIVHASRINLAQNALRAVQQHVIYSAAGPRTESPILATLAQTKVFTSDTASKQFRMRFEVEGGVADGLFGGTPFARANGIIPSVTGFRVRNGQRRYFSVQCALEPVDESARAGYLVCYKAAEAWLQGDHLEASLLLAKI